MRADILHWGIAHAAGLRIAFGDVLQKCMHMPWTMPARRG